MGWQDQGRQTHGWWGHGTTPGVGDEPTDRPGDAMFAAGNYRPRINAITHTAFLRLPRNSQNHGSATFSSEDQESLRRIITALIVARSSGASAFISDLLDLAGAGADENLCAAAEAVRTAAQAHRSGGGRSRPGGRDGTHRPLPLAAIP